MQDHQTSSQATFDKRDEASSQEDTERLQESDELPRRPRRRLLTPLPLSLTAILLLACGFIAGVLVQKGQSSTAGSAGAGLAARFSALRGTSGAPAEGTGAAGGGSTTGQGGSSPQGSAAPGARGSGSGVTVGQVAFVKGSTLYVTDTQGNTLRVKAAAGAAVSKTVSSSVRAIHPGETVLVTGAAHANGAITAQSIRVGANAAGGLGSRFSSGVSPTAPAAAGTSGEPALFGKG